jgi:hypothetical protein
MKEKKSFYDLLVEGAKPKEENKNVSKVYYVIAWIILYFSVSFLLQLSWNMAISEIFSLPKISYTQSLLFTIFLKIVRKDFF